MGWTFTADSEKQTELANNLRTGADNFDTGVTSTYSIIDGMAAGWSGEDYDQFNANTHGYEKALKDLSDTMRMFATHYDYLAVGTENLATTCVTIINNLTTGNYSVGGSGGTGGGNGNGNGTGNENGNGTGNENGNGTGNENGNGTGNENINGNENPDRWTSFEQAAGDGFPNIMTKTEFTRRKSAGSSSVAGYDSYQDYLDDMQAKYMPLTPQGAEPTTGGNGTGNENGTGTGNEIGTGTGNEIGTGTGDETGTGTENGTTAATTAAAATVSGFNEYFKRDSYYHGGIEGKTWYEGIGQDFADNFDYSKGDYIGGTVKGIIKTGSDVVETVGTAALNGTNDGLEGIQWFLNGGTRHQYDASEMNTEPTEFNESFSNNPYWTHLGEDFAENWDFSDSHGLIDYVVDGGSAILETAYDAVMVPVNGIIDAGQDVVEGFKWLWGKVF